MGIVFLVIIKLYLDQQEKEGFADISLNNMTADLQSTQNEIDNGSGQGNNNSGSDGADGNALPKCDDGNWWDKGPVKAIRSKLWGAAYNLIYQPDGNLKSPVLVPIKNPNSQSPPGCLSVTETGWHESAICAENNADQRWQVVHIGSQADFEKAMSNAKTQNSTVGFTYGYRIDKVDYPFFIVVSTDFPAQALYYNGSALGVRPLGNYDDQKWDILSEEVKDPVMTHNYNYHSKLTPELQTLPAVNQSGMQGTPLAGFQNIANNPQAIATLLQSIIQPPNAGGAFGVEGPLKVNLEMDDGIIANLAGEGSGDAGSSNNSGSVESFVNYASEYPKNKMDIPITLNYALSNSLQTSEQGNEASSNTETVKKFDMNEEGQLVENGSVEVAKNNNNSSTCNDTSCHPNMNEWGTRPFPCRACVPDEGDTW